MTFIEKAKLKHGTYYDYSNTTYINSLTKVTITCPVHGDFTQRPSDHLSGNGCPECGKVKTREKQLFSTESYINDVNIVHNNFYSYEKTKYIGALRKIVITCPIHGDFEQEASSHKRGAGCPKCGNAAAKNKNAKTISTFIEQAKILHSNKYKYSNTSYVNAATKILITCPAHGDFEQAPAVHLKGSGCPKCANSLTKFQKNYYKNKHTVFYVIYLPDYGMYKFGITTRDVKTRYASEGSVNYISIFEQSFIDGSDAWALEKLMTRAFKKYTYKGSQIFNITKNTEIITVNPVNTIIQRIIYEQQRNAT